MANIKVLTKYGVSPTSYSDSLVYSSMNGKDIFGLTNGEVFNGVGSSFAITANQTDKKITIGTGMGDIGGRQFRSDSAIEISLQTLTGIKYCVVYAQVDTKNVTAQSARILLAYDAGSYPTLSTKSLSENELEVSNMPLWRFIYTATAAKPIGSFLKLFTGKEPGAAFSARSLPGASMMMGKPIEELKPQSSDRWAKARESDSSDTTLGLGGTSIDGHLQLSTGSYGLLLGESQTIELAEHEDTGTDEISKGKYVSSGDSFSVDVVGKLPYGYKATLMGWLFTLELDKVLYKTGGILWFPGHFEYLSKNYAYTTYTDGGEMNFNMIMELKRGPVPMNSAYVSQNKSADNNQAIKISLPTSVPQVFWGQTYLSKLQVTIGRITGSFYMYTYGRIRLRPILLLKPTL